MDFLTRLFDTTGFPARWQCGLGWQEDPSLGWIHIASDIVTWLAYLLIPCVLAYFAKKRTDLVSPTIFWLFCMFILACGTVHLIEAITFWLPLYRLSAVVKLATALVSAATVVALFRIAPVAVELPGLAGVNEQLKAEMKEREDVENRLRESNEELQAFTNNVLDREDRMVELKREVNVLLHELGRQPRYASES